MLLLLLLSGQRGAAKDWGWRQAGPAGGSDQQQHECSIKIVVGRAKLAGEGLECTVVDKCGCPRMQF
jgi:hypothetical protein